MNLNVEFNKKKLQSKLNSMMNRIESRIPAVLNNIVFPEYQKIQTERWQSEGAIEGQPRWKDLNTKYAAWKKKKFAAYPGGGQLMMIRTQVLSKFTIEKPLKTIAGKKITIAPRQSEIEDGGKQYAKQANKQRPFMKFAAPQKKRFKNLVQTAINRMVK